MNYSFQHFSVGELQREADSRLNDDFWWAGRLDAGSDFGCECDCGCRKMTPMHMQLKIAGKSRRRNRARRQNVPRQRQNLVQVMPSTTIMKQELLLHERLCHDSVEVGPSLEACLQWDESFAENN